MNNSFESEETSFSKNGQLISMNSRNHKIETEVPVDEDVISLVESFLNSRRTDLKLLNGCLENMNFDEIKRICHIIKGIAEPYGFPTLGRLAREMEDSAFAKDLETTKNLLSQMIVYLEAYGVSALKDPDRVI